MFIVPIGEVKREFKMPDGIDKFEEISDIGRFFILSWKGEADVRGLAKNFIGFLNDVGQHNYCLISQLPPPS